MDTSCPSIFVNGQSLPLYIGAKVRTVVQGIQSDGADTNGTSTDEHQLTIKAFPAIPPMNFVELTGIADSYQSVHAEKWTEVDHTFDASSYNRLCKVASREFEPLFI